MQPRLRIAALEAYSLAGKITNNSNKLPTYGVLPCAKQLSTLCALPHLTQNNLMGKDSGTNSYFMNKDMKIRRIRKFSPGSTTVNWLRENSKTALSNSREGTLHH